MSAAISWLDDTTVGAWIGAELLAEHGTVGSLVPPRYESYVLVRLTGEDATVINPDRALREHLVATIKTHDPDVSRCVFAVSDVYGWDGRTRTGGAGLLQEAPATAEVDVDALQEDLQARMAAGCPAPSGFSPPPVLEIDIRSYMLYRGGIDDADAAARAGGPTEIPDLWWPEDRSWFVATDTDLTFVVVGGPRLLTTGLERPGVYVEETSARRRLA